MGIVSIIFSLKTGVDLLRQNNYSAIRRLPCENGNRMRRTRRNYVGIKNPQKKIEDVLPSLLCEMEKRHFGKSEQIIEQWSEIIGPRFSKLAKATFFKDGALHVMVKTATLYSLLVQHEKPRLLKQIQKKFPNESIYNIVFRIG